MSFLQSFFSTIFKIAFTVFSYLYSLMLTGSFWFSLLSSSTAPEIDSEEKPGIIRTVCGYLVRNSTCPPVSGHTILQPASRASQKVMPKGSAGFNDINISLFYRIQQYQIAKLFHKILHLNYFF